MVASIHGSSMLLDPVGIGHVGRVVELDHLRAPSVLRMGEVDAGRPRYGAVVIRSRSYSRVSRSWMISRWSRPRKPQRKPKPSAALRLHLEAEAGVVEAQLGDALAQLLEVGGVDREQAAEHHRLDFLEAGQRLGGGPLGVGDGVADAGLARLSLICAVMKPISPAAELGAAARSWGGSRRRGRPGGWCRRP